MSHTIEAATGLYGSTDAPADQRAAFTTGEIPVAVYGLGKMGLPLAGVYADVTGNTVGVDVDQQVVDTVNRGQNPVKREPGLDELVTETVDSGALRATTDGEAVAAGASVHVIMVPTLVTEDKEPDLSVLDTVCSTIGTGLAPGDLVIVESTVPPGTTRDRLVPLLVAESGLDPTQFGAAACPERTVSGQAIADIRGTHPKVVGGTDEESRRVATLIYDEISDNRVIAAEDATTAEAVKVFEGVYRDVNIALANQLAMYAREMGIDVNAAIEVANTQPFCDIHDPGPGVGGHCIPIYPHFLIGGFEADGSLLETAREYNESMPEFTVSMLQAIMAEHGEPPPDPSVLLLGVTYKANIAELRNAPAIAIASKLRDVGATVYGVDPLIDDWSGLPSIEGVPLERAAALDLDVVVLVTPHSEFTALDWDAFGAPILDGRQAIDRTDVTAPVYRVGGRWP